METKINKMNPKVLSYRIAVVNSGFDINAGQNIDQTMTLEELVNYVADYVYSGKKGCCFHASVFLMKLLKIVGLDSELVLTTEPTILENGETRMDLRASVLLNDGGKYVVMNPIEDIEYFEKNHIPSSSREDNYIDDTTELKGTKDGIYSRDAGNIPLEEFINKYGNGKAWTLGSLFRPESDTMTFGDLMSKAKLIDLKNYSLDGENVK